MAGSSNLANRIAGLLKDRFTHATLNGGAGELGFSVPPADDGWSKYDRLCEGLDGKDERDVAEIATRAGAKYGDFELAEAGFAVLEKGEKPLSEITRRDVAKCFGDDLSGERGLIALIRRYFPIDQMTIEVLAFDSLEERIDRHMVRNPGDWSVEELFNYIGAYNCSRTRFVALVQDALHPLARRGEEQARLAAAIGAVLKRDGYECAIAGEESGYPIYQIRPSVRGVQGAAKNLIFASIGPKPELGFADAINNDIVVLSHEDSCLIYDRSIRRDGLLWSELVDWWRDINPMAGDPAKGLGGRLRQSLSSDAERNMFDWYFKLYRPQLGEKLPAFIPQVYLHYDPATVKNLRHRSGLPRQRMDFLLLLPNFQRVVIEVDGSHHFSRDGQPSLPTYSDMVAADRNLRLNGYEIYRFGANELVGSEAQSLIKDFFDRLWGIHKVG